MKIQRRRLLQSSVGGAVIGLAGCSASGAGQGGGDPAAGRTDGDGEAEAGRIGDGELILATTTSTYDTGLLGELNPVYEASYGVTVKTVPKGTGASLRTARDGDADVVLVHARPAEDQFMADGFGVNRRDVMYNDFVVVGPEEDPADINGMESVRDAFAAIASANAEFISRGDDSGTHKKERQVWAASDVERDVSWYHEIGQGMGETLVHTNEVGGYTIADRGTFLSMRSEIDLVIHVQGPLEGGPPLLKNPYGVIAVNPGQYDDVNYQAAMSYIGFLTGPKGQRLIANYTANGTQLFYPNAITEGPAFEQYVPAGAADAVTIEPDSGGGQSSTSLGGAPQPTD